MPKRSEPTLASGVYAAILTPRGNQSTEANVSGFLDYLDRIARAAVNGLVLFGSTGEFVHYDIQDRMRVVGLAVKRSRVPTLVNVSHSSLQGALDMAEQADVAGAAGILLMPPYFFRYEDAEIERFYLDFLSRRSSSLPVYLYNLPFFTNHLSTELAGKLLRSGAFAGIKDSSGDWPFFESLLQLRREVPFQALVGNEGVYFRGLETGGDGIVSGIAAALPELPLAAAQAHASGDKQRLEQLAARMEELLAWVRQFPASVIIKYLAESRGWLPVQLAVPLGAEAAAKILQFQTWCAEWLPAVLRDCSGRAT